VAAGCGQIVFESGPKQGISRDRGGINPQIRPAVDLS
jgi:hypothetical protein